MDYQSHEIDRQTLAGFSTNLPNGLTVSVQWHNRAYSKRDGKNGKIRSVEIACWVTDKQVNGFSRGEWMTRRVWPNEVRRDREFIDDVVGYVSVADVIQFIDDAQKY